MGGFTINYDKTADKFILPEGEYEVIIIMANEDTTPAGTPYINIPMAVRNDVNQKHKNTRIWHKIWQKREPTDDDRACDGYNSKQINSLSRAVGFPNNHRYETLKDWCNDLKHKVLRVTVKHEEYKNNIEARIQGVNLTKIPACSHQFDEKKASRSGLNPDMPPAHTDDDLPF